MYARDVSVTRGQELLTTTLIRPKSPIRQVYASCCHTPLLRWGSMSVVSGASSEDFLLVSHHLKPSHRCFWSQLMNSNLIPNDSQPPVEFRIIGRQAWKDEKNRPGMSFSVPFRWFWTMPRRVRPELRQRTPSWLTDTKYASILQEFQPGSASSK